MFHVQFHPSSVTERRRGAVGASVLDWPSSEGEDTATTAAVQGWSLRVNGQGFQ